MTEAVTQQINWLRQVAPYIDAHRNHTLVLVMAGEVLGGAQCKRLIQDLALLHGLGMRVVLVHGARPQVEARVAQAGSQSRYVQGLRITDEAALQALKAAVGQARLDIEALLTAGLADTPGLGDGIRVASGNYVIAKPVGVRNGIDYRFTGEVRRVDTSAIQGLLDRGYLCLLPPLGFSRTGEVFNLNAAALGQAVASALHADKLIYLETVDFTGQAQAPGELNRRELGPAKARALAQDEARTPVMAERLRQAAAACLDGVPRVHLIDARHDGGLLLEIYTRDGVGMLVTNQRYEDIRSAAIADVNGILALIEPLEQEGILVRRSREQLELEIDRFIVQERDGMVIACGALYTYGDGRIAELACLAVNPDYRNQGRGDRLLQQIQALALRSGVQTLFVLTTRTAHWFRERGFRPASLDSLPIARQQLYNYQRNSLVFVKPLR